MTQEEKLEEAKRLYETANADQKYVLESLFPELTESEDERIMENIIATIHLYYGEPLEDEAKEMIAWLEKRGETSTILSNSSNIGKNKQKSAWSEDDEERLQSCLNILQAKGIMGVTETVNSKWLKSLKDRVQPQPKQEWCEEDNRILSTLTKYLEEHGGGIDGWECSFLSKWLKSLRPQNRWKPSDEQIEALDDVISSRDIKYDVLSELWKDLKKLK